MIDMAAEVNKVRTRRRRALWVAVGLAVATALGWAGSAALRFMLLD